MKLLSTVHYFLWRSLHLDCCSLLEFFFYLKFAFIILGPVFLGNSISFQTVDSSSIYIVNIFLNDYLPFSFLRYQLWISPLPVYFLLIFLTLCFHFSSLIFIMLLTMFSSMSSFCCATNSFAFSPMVFFNSFLLWLFPELFHRTIHLLVLSLTTSPWPSTHSQVLIYFSHWLLFLSGNP